MTKIKKPLVSLLALFTVITLAQSFLPASIGGANIAHAGKDPANMSQAEKERCYTDYNGDKPPIPNSFYVICGSTAKQIEDNGPGFCALNNTTKVIVCPNVAADRAAQENAERAETAPLILAVCGQAPSGNSASPGAIASYTTCANTTRTIYTECSSSGGSATSEVQVDAATTARCVKPRIDGVPGSQRPSVNDITSAVTAGRNEKKRLTDAIADSTAKTECEKKSGTWANGSCTEPAGEDEDIEPVCRGGALGWILCPLSEIAVEITDIFGGLIEGVLTFQPLLSREPNSQGALIYQVWSIVVGVANVLLVIAFLIVVFSQATSIGLSNYGVKKMLPKIIAAAILMNLSFFLCAIAVDISNILGQGVRGVVQAAISSLPPVPEIKELGGDGKLQQGANFGQYVAFFATGTLALGIAAATGALWAAIPILVTAATFLLTLFVMLALRNVLIALLIIAAPLAFVAMILPGTNGLFEKWKKLFIALLAVFPIIMGLLYVGILMSHITMLTLDPGASAGQKLVISMLALIMAFAGTIAAPTILTKATGVVGNLIAGRLNNPNKGLIDRSKRMSEERKARNPYQRMKKERKSERERMRSRDFAAKMSAQNRGGKIRRAAFGGVAVTPAQRAARREAYDGIYDANREDISKMTERVRDRATDAGAFTASSAYSLKNKDGSQRQVDKDTWMYEMYTNKDAKGTVKNLAGEETEFDAGDNFFNSAIASQAAKSGDKAMYGKLLTRSMEMQKSTDASTQEAGAKLEFRLRDFGINNAGVVSGGHPDVIKGEYSAFKSINADGLLAMDGSAVERMGTYLNDRQRIFDDLRIGTENKVRTEWAKDPTKQNATEAEIMAERNKLLGAQTVDAEGNVTAWATEGQVISYQNTAQEAFQEAVVQLNTKDIYSGKAVEGSDLDKAIRKAAGVMSMPSDVRIVSRSKQAQQSPTTTVTPQGETISEGGIVIPRGVNVTPTPEATSATSAPASPAPSPAATAPQPDVSSTQQQRQRGGNFGGFNAPPAPPPPPTPAGQQTTQTDSSGRQTPGSTTDPDAYQQRFGDGR